MPEHVDITTGEIHKSHNWEYANAGAREGATGFVAGDVKKLALQLDDYSYWTLIDDSPVAWRYAGGGMGHIAADEVSFDPAGLDNTAATDLQEALEDFDAAISVASGTTPGDYTASEITNVPAGGIAATDVQSALDELDSEKAPKASPTFTGTPAAPTAAGGTNTTQIATTAFVAAAVAALINSAPGALDTLDELAAALGDDANFAATLTTSLAGKQDGDADLTAIAGLTPSNDDVLQRKAGAWVNRTMVQLLADLAATATAVAWSAKQTFNKATVQTPVALTDAATIATDASLGNRFRASSATDRTLGAPTNASDGQQCTWRWKNTDSGARTLTLTTGSAGAFRYNGSITVLPATAAGKAIKFTAEYDSTDQRWDVAGYVNDI